MNSTYNVSLSTKQVLKEEFALGAAITLRIEVCHECERGVRVLKERTLDTSSRVGVVV